MSQNQKDSKIKVKIDTTSEKRILQVVKSDNDSFKQNRNSEKSFDFKKNSEFYPKNEQISTNKISEIDCIVKCKLGNKGLIKELSLLNVDSDLNNDYIKREKKYKCNRRCQKKSQKSSSSYNSTIKSLEKGQKERYKTFDKNIYRDILLSQLNKNKQCKKLTTKFMPKIPSKKRILKGKANYDLISTDCLGYDLEEFKKQSKAI